MLLLRDTRLFFYVDRIFSGEILALLAYYLETFFQLHALVGWRTETAELALP